MSESTALADAMCTTLIPSVSSPSPEGIVAARPGLARSAGVALLERLLEQPTQADRALSRALRADRRLGSRDRRAVQEVVVGVLRRHALLARLLTDAGQAADAEGLWAAELALGQGLPEQAPPGVSVEAARRLIAALEPAAALALLGSLPEPVAARWVARYGALEAAALVAALNERAPVTLRANRRLTTREALAAALPWPTTPGRWAPDALLLEGRGNPVDSAAFRAGRFEVQDEGSQLLAELACPPPGGRVLDLCAGAGGKTLALAALLPPGARVEACDVRPHALDEARQRLARAGGPPVTVRAVPEAGPLDLAPAEVVLVDAPCTGSGTLRRKPGLRWRLDEARIAALVALQADLLERAAAVVKPGGLLVYATCSLLDDEDRAVVAGFLARHPAWRIEPVAARLGAQRAAALGAVDDLELLPHLHGTDGFFAACLRAP